MKNFNSHLYEVNVLKSTVPAMRYKGDIPFTHWQKQAKEKLTELLCLPLQSCPLNLDIEYQKEFDEYTEYRFTVQTEPEYFVPCHLLIPKNGKESNPLTICLNGHGGGMHVALGRAKNQKDQDALAEWHHRATALRSIKEGRCALTIEARNFGEASLEGYGISCTESTKIALLMGRTVIGERVWDAMRVLDCIEQSFKQVDTSGIVCTGNSAGGTATFYLACMDERIAFAAPCCSVCTYEDSIAAMHHCMCNFIPGIRKFFEMSDLAGIIAPRKLVIAAGEKDNIFPIEPTKRNFDHIRTLYSHLDAAENCALLIGEAGHLNYADQIWEKLYQMGI